MQALLHFIHGILAQSFVLQMWVLLLALLNCALPIYFIRKWEAQLVFIVFIINSLLMLTLTAQFGYTRILGLGHFLWFPLLWYLRRRRRRHPWDTAYGAWLYGTILFNSISLILDVIDVIRYTFGDRGELFPGA